MRRRVKEEPNEYSKIKSHYLHCRGSYKGRTEERVPFGHSLGGSMRQPSPPINGKDWDRKKKKKLRIGKHQVINWVGVFCGGARKKSNGGIAKER